MKKRVSCRIISSVPIGSPVTAIQPISQRTERLYESDELHAASFWAKQSHKVKDLNAFGICMGILNTVPAGQILDYLA